MDGTALVWDAQTGEELYRLDGHSAGVSSAAYSPDGKYIVTASEDHTARVWQLPEGSRSPADDQTVQPLLTLEGHSGWVRSAAYSPDGQHILTASDDGTVRVWDAQTGRPVRSLEGHTGRVWSAINSPDGQHIVTASDDGTARIWDVWTGQPLRVLEGHTDQVWSAAYSPDGQYIVTGSADLTARIWTARIEDLLDLAESLIQRDPPVFTPEERERFLRTDIPN